MKVSLEAPFEIHFSLSEHIWWLVLNFATWAGLKDKEMLEEIKEFRFIFNKQNSKDPSGISCQIILGFIE